ncbi:uncharacterized protein LOC144136079 isoform X1 [Amblyomma americanum]
MTIPVILTALLIASCTNCGTGSTNEHLGLAEDSPEHHGGSARTNDHRLKRAGAYDPTNFNPSGNIGEKGKVLKCETEGYKCTPMDSCQHWIFKPFLFGCQHGQVCCEKSPGNICAGQGSAYPGRCVPKNTGRCMSRRPASDCKLNEMCCRNRNK